MATKFLDYTGLSYLWSKIKGWCNSIFVTKATDENITGTKTFVGSKKIAFKQSGANDKLGFTLFNNSGKEQGYLEYNPTNKIAGVPLMTLGNYATAANELTYVGFRRYSNISGASGAYNLLTPLISDAKSHFNLTTTYTNFYLPLGISDGTNIVTADNGGVVNISSLLPSISTIGWSDITSKPTTISGYGITDAKIDNGTITLGSNTITPLTSHQTLPSLSRTISGSGNAITDITVSGHAITATKGTTFLTSHQTLPTLSLTTSGSGNAITALSVSGHAITATKGSTFLTSHQDISGKVNKSGDTMTGGLTITNSNTLKLKHTGITRGTAPSASVYPFFVEFKDNVDKTIGGLYYTYDTNKVAKTYLMCYKGTTNENTWNSIGIGYDASGNVFTWAPTPATADNSTKIATTAFVKAQGYITSSGSITGNAATATKTTATVAVDTTGELVRATMASNDVFRIAVGGASNAGWAEIATGDDYNEPIYVRQYQGVFTTLKRTATLLDGSGNTSFPGIVTATGFSGPLTGDVNGNATTVSGTAGTSLLAWNTENTVYTVGGHAIKVKLPANPNSNWTSHLYAGASNGNANAATTNGNTYLIICDNTTARDRRLIKGTGATTVTSDANGVITIHSTDNNTVYTHPTTSGNKHIPSGGKSGQILRWSADGTAAWGNDNNTTYSVATQSADGLMSAADKKKLDGIAASADSIPVGAIIYYTNKTVPANFLICNGGAVSRTTYATLFSVIGTTFGKGNGSSTFNVPNLIGRFPEGNATPGTVHNAGLPDITGTIHYHVWSDTVSGAFYDNGGQYRDGTTNYQTNGSTGGCKGFSAARSSSIYGASSTVQPPALTLVPCIRYA